MEHEEYDRMAAMADRHWWYAATRATLSDLLAPHLHPGARVLDAGGGTGSTGSWLAAERDLVALDPVAPALATYAAREPAARPVTGSISALPFASASFDAVVCVTVLYHAAVADPAAAVAEMARVTRPGGVVVLWEPGVRRLRRAHDRVTHGARRFSRRDVRALAERSGLEPVRTTGVYTFLVPPAAVKALVERGASASDLDRADAGLGGVLPTLARAERSVLRRVSLPFGLSVAVVARRPR